MEAASRVALNTCDIPFIQPAVKDDHVFASVVVIVTGKIDLKLPSHVPSNASPLEMLWLANRKSLDFVSFCNDLLLTQAQAVP
jgi:hypothetical protein